MPPKKILISLNLKLGFKIPFLINIEKDFLGKREGFIEKIGGSFDFEILGG